MSGNSLSKNHPFRASVTHGSVDIPPVSTTTAVASNNDNEEKPKSTFNFSVKTKITGFGLLGLIITYGWIQIYDSLYPQSKKVVTTSESSDSEKISYDEMSDYEWGISNLADSQNEPKPSWFKQTFCKGVKRSFFCR